MWRRPFHLSCSIYSLPLFAKQRNLQQAEAQSCRSQQYNSISRKRPLLVFHYPCRIRLLIICFSPACGLDKLRLVKGFFYIPVWWSRLTEPDMTGKPEQPRMTNLRFQCIIPVINYKNRANSLFTVLWIFLLSVHRPGLCFSAFWTAWLILSILFPRKSTVFTRFCFSPSSQSPVHPYLRVLSFVHTLLTSLERFSYFL